jgi:L-ascorbate metabolism protein UlaG (beta-lactamase superfamily)
MYIEWFGHSCFRIQTQQGSLLIDPFSKDIGLTPPRVNTDIVVFSHRHSDHYNENYASRDGVFIIDGPGDYEKSGIAITAADVDHDAKGGVESGRATIIRIEAEDVAIGFLSDICQDSLRDGQRAALGAIDVLLVPVGGKYTLGKKQLATVGPKGAVSLINQLQPAIAIPMHYKMKGVKLPLEYGVESFIKEMGLKDKDVETLPKLSIKKKDLEGKKTRVVLLTAE